MNDVITIIQEKGVEFLGRYYSKYRGIVVDNQDPDNIQTLKVYLPSVHNGVYVKAIPSNQQGGLDYGVKLLTPRVGEIVYIEFEGGNPLKALWSYHGWAVKEVPSELKEPNTLGIVTPKGNKIILKEDEDILTISIAEDKCNIILDKDQILIKRGLDTSLIITDKGFTVEKGEYSLKKTLDDLLTAIQKLTVTTNVGPSGVPINIADFKKIQEELNNYLEK